MLFPLLNTPLPPYSMLRHNRTITNTSGPVMSTEFSQNRVQVHFQLAERRRQKKIIYLLKITH